MKGEKRQYGALAKAIHGIDVLDSTVGEGISSGARRTIYDIDNYISPQYLFVDNHNTATYTWPGQYVPPGRIYLVHALTFTASRDANSGQANMVRENSSQSVAQWCGPVTPLAGDIVDMIGYALKPIVLPPGYRLTLANNKWQAGDTWDITISWYEVEI